MEECKGLKSGGRERKVRREGLRIGRERGEEKRVIKRINKESQYHHYF